MLGFVEYMMANPPALVAFLVVTYLFVLAMILPPAFKPEKQKGKSLVLVLHSGQKVEIDLGSNVNAKISASSEDEFALSGTSMDILSEQFNIFTHIGSGMLRSADRFVVSKGESVSLEITAQDDLKSTKTASLSQKVSGVIAALLILGIWSFLGYIMLSLVG